MKLMRISLLLVFLLFVSVSCINLGTSKNINHKIKKRADGGYTIILSGSITHLMPLSPEGPFPKQGVNYQIELKGHGKDWGDRGQPGLYYSYPDNIECNMPQWDVGYAWVDKNRHKIYLNLYWVMSPDALSPSVINGSYNIE